MTYTGSPKRYRVTWRWNRTHELRLGQSLIAFAPHGSQLLDENQVGHAEFQNQIGDFVVEEVSDG